MLDNFDGLLDGPRLNAWIEAQPDIPGTGPVTSVVALTGGSQNVLFRLEREGGSFILRRPPRHLRANSNATMNREALLLAALRGSAVPHADLYAACSDESVIGAAFYVMRPLEGFSPSGELPGQYATDPSWRNAMGEVFVQSGAALAAVDYQAVGLAGYGKPDNWHARQIDRWRSQLEGYTALPGYDGHQLVGVDAIARWLEDNLPNGRRIGIIHGDFQYPNVMYRYDAPVIAGLIDWELSTLGDPLLDLGWMLTSWREESDPEGGTPRVLPWDAFLTRRELVALYGELTGRDMSEMPWFFVLACYKLACILEGTNARAKAGQTTTEMGEKLHAHAVWLLAKAQQIIAQGDI
jgi:aminoglycoside phosphotransferase (APT) family kinase protein